MRISTPNSGDHRKTFKRVTDEMVASYLKNNGYSATHETFVKEANLKAYPNHDTSFFCCLPGTYEIYIGRKGGIEKSRNTVAKVENVLNFQEKVKSKMSVLKSSQAVYNQAGNTQRGNIQRDNFNDPDIKEKVLSGRLIRMNDRDGQMLQNTHNQNFISSSQILNSNLNKNNPFMHQNNSSHLFNTEFGDQKFEINEKIQRNQNFGEKKFEDFKLIEDEFNSKNQKNNEKNEIKIIKFKTKNCNSKVLKIFVCKVFKIAIVCFEDSLEIYDLWSFEVKHQQKIEEQIENVSVRKIGDYYVICCYSNGKKFSIFKYFGRVGEFTYIGGFQSNFDMTSMGIISEDMLAIGQMDGSLFKVNLQGEDENIVILNEGIKDVIFVKDDTFLINDRKNLYSYDFDRQEMINEIHPDSVEYLKKENDLFCFASNSNVFVFDSNFSPVDSDGFGVKINSISTLSDGSFFCGADNGFYGKIHNKKIKEPHSCKIEEICAFKSPDCVNIICSDENKNLLFYKIYI